MTGVEIKKLLDEEIEKACDLAAAAEDQDLYNQSVGLTDFRDHIKSIEKKEKKRDDGSTREEIAVASYEMFMGAMALLQTRLDRSSAKNYISINLEGISAPFDRMQMHFVRPGGKAPLEVVSDLRGLLVQALDLLDDCADGYDVDAREEGIHKGEGQALRDLVAQMRAKIPPPPWEGP
jgi:hypothetical protein